MLKWVIAAKGGGGDGGDNTKEGSTFYRAKLNHLVFRNKIYHSSIIIMAENKFTYCVSFKTLFYDFNATL